MCNKVIRIGNGLPMIHYRRGVLCRCEKRLAGFRRDTAADSTIRHHVTGFRINRPRRPGCGNGLIISGDSDATLSKQMNRTELSGGELAGGVQPTDALLSLVADLDFDALPVKAVDRAKMAILDLIGCALAGADTDAVHPLVKLAYEESGEGQAVV